MPARPRLFALAAATSLTFAGTAGAEEAWLAASGSCSASATEVGRRVDAALAGSRSKSARAVISTAESENGVYVTVDLWLGRNDAGSKSLLVPSCEEAIDAAVLVLAVALGEPSPGAPEPGPHASRAREPSGAAAERVLVPATAQTWTATGASERQAPVADGAESKRPALGVVVLGGIDVNTLPNTTPYVGGAVALLALPVELRAAFRYGIRREDENQETELSERTRAEFAALELSACRGLGTELRFSLCAGGELGVVHRTYVRREGGDSVDVDESTPRFAGVVTGRVEHSVGAVRLELDLAGSAVALGPEGAPRASLRLGAGAGTQF